jgi:hypothetical protein
MKKGNIAQISEYSSGTSQYQCIVSLVTGVSKEPEQPQCLQAFRPRLASNDYFTTKPCITVGKGNAT